MADLDRNSEQFVRELGREVLAGGVKPLAGGSKPPVADKAMEHLRGEQLTALECLLAGRSVPDAAEVSRVSRRTIYRWIKHDPAFAAAYNQWHEEMKENCRSRLLMLAGKATGAIEKALEAGDAKSALQLLKGIGLLEAMEARATDEEDVRREAEIERKRRKTEQEVAEIEMRADVARAKEEERVWKS